MSRPSGFNAFTPAELSGGLARASARVAEAVQQELDDLHRTFGITPGNISVTLVPVTAFSEDGFEARFFVGEVRLSVEVDGIAN